MDIEKRDIQQIKDIVEEEGLGYSVQNCIDASEIEDLKLAELWEAARKALLAVDFYLGNH